MTSHLEKDKQNRSCCLISDVFFFCFFSFSDLSLIKLSISGEAAERQDQQLDCHAFQDHPRLQYGQHQDRSSKHPSLRLCNMYLQHVHNRFCFKWPSLNFEGIPVLAEQGRHPVQSVWLHPRAPPKQPAAAGEPEGGGEDTSGQWAMQAAGMTQPRLLHGDFWLKAKL